MTGEDDKSRLAESGSGTSSLFVVFRTIGDTTWRMFAPVIVGGLVGWWIDGAYGTEYAALVGSVIGLVLAGLLVWKQYADVTKEDKK